MEVIKPLTTSLSNLNEHYTHLINVISQMTNNTASSPMEAEATAPLNKFDIASTLNPQLGGLILFYSKCFLALGAMDLDTYKDKLLHLTKTHSEVSALIETQDKLINSFHNQLALLDQHIYSDNEHTTVINKENNMNSIELIDAKTEDVILLRNIYKRNLYTLIVLLRHYAWLPWREHVKALSKFTEQFTALNTQIVIVGFFNINHARSWIHEVSCEYSFLVDQNKHFYEILNFKPAYNKVWNINTIQYYAMKVAHKSKLVSPLEDDDVMQMGGNAIIDSLGQILYTHPSETPIDRPTPEDIIRVVKNFKSSKL